MESMHSLEDRPRYRTDAGVCWSRLPVVLIAALVLALVVAVALAWAQMNLLYVPVILPAFLAIVLALFMTRFVDSGRLRNPWVAAAVGGLTGLTAYVGHHAICTQLILLSAWPLENPVKTYVRWRFQRSLQIGPQEFWLASGLA